MPPADSLEHRFFFLGNLDTDQPEYRTTLRAVSRDASVPGSPSTVFLLGNVVSGPAEVADEDYLGAAERLLGGLASSQVDVVAIPGEREYGTTNAKGTRLFADRLLHHPKENMRFAPRELEAGPRSFGRGKSTVVLAIDTQWWLNTIERGETVSSDDDLSAMLSRLERALQRHRKRNVIIVGHHAVFTTGPTSRSLRALGALTRFGAPSRGFHSPAFRSLRSNLIELLERYPGAVYVSSHQRTHEYLEAHGVHYLVSGTAASGRPVASSSDLVYGTADRGYSSISVTLDGAVWLEMHSVLDGRSETIYRQQLSGPLNREDTEEEVEDLFQIAGPAIGDSSIVTPISLDYDAGPLSRFAMGNNYRKLWSTAVRLPILDLDRQFGGIRPVRQGGGLQSTTVRMVDRQERQYALRSVNKDRSKGLPSEFARVGIISNVVRDQTSSFHPFGYLMVPPLAEASGIYHAVPEVYYVPRDDRMGSYADKVSDLIMMLEQRPDDDMSHAENFGFADEVVGAVRMATEVTEDNDYRVDEKMFIKARLFDALIADWDRHHDQWRWSQEDGPEEGTHLFRPIPRDRDVAFNRLNSVFMTLARPYIKYQDFRNSIGSVVGLSTQSANQDHRFFSSPTKSDWMEAASELQASITSAAIAEAVSRLPEEIRDENGPFIGRTLRRRLEALPKTAERFYQLHARLPDVIGSDKHELFSITRSEATTRVEVFKTTKEGDIRRKFYDRTFTADETRELRLFGLGGNDRFVVAGDGDGGMVLVVVGGPGLDSISDPDGNGRVHYYDTEVGESSVGGHVRMHISQEPGDNLYDPDDFAFDTRVPTFLFGFDTDLGSHYGGAVAFSKAGFRSHPQAALTTVGFSWLPSGGFRASLDRLRVNAFTGWNSQLRASLAGPSVIRNYFGSGNETIADTALSNTFEFGEIAAMIGAERALGGDGRLTAATEIAYRNARPLSAPARELAVVLATADVGVSMERLDDPGNVRNGFRVATSVAPSIQIGGTDFRFIRWRAEATMYASLARRQKLTIATRLGAERLLGDYPYFDGAFLGLYTGLRGQQRSRFSGDGKFFVNGEIRLGVASWFSGLPSDSYGLIGFADVGRVWADGESSEVWHSAFGAGAFVDLFGQSVLSVYSGWSGDGTSLRIGAGFGF